MLQKEKGAKLLQKPFPLIPGLQIQDDVAMDKSAKQIGNQTVLPQILEKLSANDAKSELAREKQTEYRQKDSFFVFLQQQ